MKLLEIKFVRFVSLKSCKINCFIFRLFILQVSLEQYSLLGMETITEFCERLSKVITRRISENASYATRFVQLLSKVVSMYPAKTMQPLDQSLRPLRRAILSHSLGRMFKAVDNAFEENDLANISVAKVCLIYSVHFIMI